MSSEKAAKIYDTVEEPWKAPLQPDPTPQENAVILAAKRYAEADDILTAWGLEHPIAGPTAEALKRCWRSRRTELLEAARRL